MYVYIYREGVRVEVSPTRMRSTIRHIASAIVRGIESFLMTQIPETRTLFLLFHATFEANGDSKKCYTIKRSHRFNIAVLCHFNRSAAQSPGYKAIVSVVSVVASWRPSELGTVCVGQPTLRVSLIIIRPQAQPLIPSFTQCQLTLLALCYVVPLPTEQNRAELY